MMFETERLTAIAEAIAVSRAEWQGLEPQGIFAQLGRTVGEPLIDAASAAEDSFYLRTISGELVHFKLHFPPLPELKRQLQENKAAHRAKQAQQFRRWEEVHRSRMLREVVASGHPALAAKWALRWGLEPEAFGLGGEATGEGEAATLGAEVDR